MSKPSVTPLSAEVRAIFDKLVRFLGSEVDQNNTIPDHARPQITNGLNCDEFPNARGEFGRTPLNPIPTNGPLGEVIYLSKLRTQAKQSWWRLRKVNGSPIMFHRVGTQRGIAGDVDAYEVISLDGTVHETLFLSMYHPRKSKKVPSGYFMATNFDSVDIIYGVNFAVENFPEKLDVHIRSWSKELFRMPFPVDRVRETISDSRFGISLLDADRQNQSKAQDTKGAISNNLKSTNGEDLKVNHKVFQTHIYNGNRNPELWAQSRLQIICVQSVHTIRREVRGLGVGLVPSYWYECIYLAYFFFTIALMKAKFRGDPTSWADETIRGTIKQLLAVRFEGETFPFVDIEQGLETYRERYEEYWSHLHALTKEASDSELTFYTIQLAEIFTDTSYVLVGAKLLGLSHEIFSLIDSSIKELAISIEQI